MTFIKRLTFKTAYCTNALSALLAAGIHQVSRLERTVRYQFSGPLPDDETLLEIAGDRMTECIYMENIDFTAVKERENFFQVDVLGDPANLDKGATTGTGGRIRDTHATGRGSHEIAGIAGYSFGNLHLPNYRMPWEHEEDKYPYSFSHPRTIAIEASNGASDYGNKFGEPVICGFARSFGQRLANGERCEYVKPIMFSGGIGAIDDGQTCKEHCREGMYLAKIGGPVYRVGVGGGAASSQSVQGSRESTLDFCAVQRGDAEMGQKLHRVIRACAELGASNPILAIHDQGAGGNGNVLKELVEGGGAVINASSFELGDDTISARELWTAEYQENDACLIESSGLARMMQISRREKCTVSVVGTVTDEKRVVLTNFVDDVNDKMPVDFDTKILGEREKKVFHLTSVPTQLTKLELPARLTVREALEMVLRLPSVASKRYLTCKVDRSVTGLIAQQQCVGPLHTPLADVAVVALSYFDKRSIVLPKSGDPCSSRKLLNKLVDFNPVEESSRLQSLITEFAQRAAMNSCNHRLLVRRRSATADQQRGGACRPTS
ncbi:hypothetical protein NECAME_10009 [Necator americanus]|uniref:Uncharacterized protein n=1 Tax=Necator americanus TaxID=51031 RepID=W2TAQ5_NECAM|nr:hypothetical protein NECAME_10009 [Necator americanus]ETN79120.1 hypothetical protein NECAME_10009 [Necator americanus]